MTARENHLVEARPEAPRRRIGGLEDVDVILGEFVDETRGRRGLPQAADLTIGGEIDRDASARAGDADIGEATLLFEAGQAVFVDRALAREQPLLPARQ